MLEETAHVWCAPPEHTHNRGKVSYVIHPLDTPLAHFTVVRAVWPPMRTLLAKVSLPHALVHGGCRVDAGAESRTRAHDGVLVLRLGLEVEERERHCPLTTASVPRNEPRVF
jgi:hypothetical protein